MLAKATIVALFILLVWGNIVAGLKAGLACPDWPLCHGQFIPSYRWDVYVEFIHRVLGAITSVLIIILAWKRLRKYVSYFKLVPVVCVLLLIIQIVLGGLVVLLKLPVDLTTVHFANAIIIFSLTLYMAFFDGQNRVPRISISGPGGIFILLSFLIFIQAVLGAYVRHSASGLACPDFPTCLGFWVPPSLSGQVLNHYSHRILAYLIFIVILALLVFSRNSKNFDMARPYLKAVFIFIIIQIALGAVVVLSGLTFYVTALHLSIGLVILSLTLFIWFKYLDTSYI